MDETTTSLVRAAAAVVIIVGGFALFNSNEVKQNRSGVNENNDIVIKTDVGEKFIVKESTVTLFPRDSEELFARLEKKAVNYFERIQHCRKVHPELAKAGVLCKGGNDWEEGVFLPDKFKADIVFEPETLHWIEVQYRPIFITINNFQSALGYKAALCRNPKLKSNTLKAWKYVVGPISAVNPYGGMDSISEGNKRWYYESFLLGAVKEGGYHYKLEEKVCDKHAKF